MKTLIGALLLMLTISTYTIAASIPYTVTKWSQDNVFTVDGDNGGVGSGWWIDNETFITACHVVGQAGDYYTYDEHSDTWQWLYTEIVSPEAQVANQDRSVVMNLKVESCNFDNDIAVLKRQWIASDSEFTAPVTYGIEPYQGEEVFCSGYGLSLNLHTTVGHYQGDITREGAEGYELVTCLTMFGDSGSPALVFRSGKVYYIGVRQAVANGGGHPIEHLTMITDARTILEETR